MENIEINNIHSKEFKAILKGLIDNKEFKREILLNGSSSSCKGLNDIQKESLSRKFKEWVSNNIICLANEEVGFILDCDSGNKPFEWEDVTNMDTYDTERLIDDLIDNVEEKDFSKVNDEYNRRIKTIGDFEVFLNSLDSEELRDYTNNETDLDYCEYEEQNEIYQWFKVSYYLCELLEEQGEITINDFNYWGRGSCGQSVELDYCIHEAFLKVWCR
jgi:hypothetical protein